MATVTMYVHCICKDNGVVLLVAMSEDVSLKSDLMSNVRKDGCLATMSTAVQYIENATSPQDMSIEPQSPAVLRMRKHVTGFIDHVGPSAQAFLWREFSIVDKKSGTSAPDVRRTSLLLWHLHNGMAVCKGRYWICPIRGNNSKVLVKPRTTGDNHELFFSMTEYFFVEEQLRRENWQMRLNTSLRQREFNRRGLSSKAVKTGSECNILV